MVSNCRDKATPDSYHHQTHLSKRDHFTEHGSRRWKGVLLPNHQNLRMHESHSLFEILEGLLISSAWTVLNHHGHSLPLISATDFLWSLIPIFWSVDTGRNVVNRLVCLVEIFSLSLLMLLFCKGSLWGSSQRVEILQNSIADAEDDEVPEKSLDWTLSPLH